MTRGERSRLGVGEALEGLARLVTEWTGGSWAFAVALATIIVWE
jgi:low affinity Fe/Cu permease